MIFYVALDQAGRKVACKTQDEAKAVNKAFTKIDVPTDKDGLHAMLQEFFDQLDAVKQDQPTTASVVAAEPAPTPKQKCDEPLKDTIAFCAELSERWPQLPWGLKSDLCCIFIEDLRSKIKPTIPVEPKDPDHVSPPPDHSPADGSADSPSPGTSEDS